jgi:hypothetical protein
MRTKIYQRKDLNSFKLPSIFGAKNMNFKWNIIFKYFLFFRIN